LLVSLLAACLLVQNVSATGYPSTYPFEYEFVDLPEATPSLSFDQSDAGGYLRASLFCDLNDFELKISEGLFHTPWHCERMRFYLVQIGIPDVEPPGSAPLNCSRGDGVFIDSSFLADNAVYDGKTFECAEYVNTQSVMPNSLADGMADIMLASSCPTPPEPFVCLIIFRGISWCFDQYLSPSERLKIMPCVDIVPHFLSTCNIFIPFNNNRPTEPDAYWSSMTVQQTLVADALWYDSDRVCHPYSYFFPDATAEQENQTTEDSETESDNSSESSLFHTTFWRVW